jgi:hypothetical protein
VAFLRFDCSIIKKITCWFGEENTTGSDWSGDSFTALEYDHSDVTRRTRDGKDKPLF